jgi:hypothetical protein
LSIVVITVNVRVAGLTDERRRDAANERTKLLHSFTGGGYEVVNSTTLPGTGDLFVDSAVKLLIQCAHEVGK